MKNLISFTTGTLLTGIAYFLGGWDTAIQTLILVMGIDYITGVIKAIKKKKLNSKTGLWGIAPVSPTILSITTDSITIKR